MSIYRTIDNETVWNLLDAEHPVIDPLSPESVDRLLGQVDLPPGARVIDIGCGLGALLLRALELHPGTTGVGVDISAAHVEKAGEQARKRGLADRLATHVADANTFDTGGQTYDLVMCMGLSAALGGLRATLDRLRPLVAPGGHLLLGEAFWTRPPSPGALAALDIDSDTHSDLDGLFDAVIDGGWAPVYAYESTRREWDDFGWACVRALADWGMSETDPATRAGVLRFMADYRDSWLQGYRDSMGFASVLLRPVPAPLTAHTARRRGFVPWAAD